MESDGDVDMLAAPDESASKQCFTPIQNRKIVSMSMPAACSLCPSMDLIVLAIGDALWIHRTVSWQRLATWKQDDCAVRHVCWSPDGRTLALVLTDGTVALHHVEALSSEEETGQVHSISLPDAVSLVWTHVGRPHPSWILSEEEIEREVSWRYQSRYLDRASTFLPPSSYHIHDEGGEPVSVATKTRPSCQTPLSLLCVATSEHNIHLYLYGRYEIATLACTGSPNSMVCSSDLTKVLVQGSSSRFTLYSLPALAEHRYQLQTISALYCSMTSHLQAIQQHAKEVAGSWKSSLKPLDTKLEGLARLLNSYGVSKDVRSALQRYILVGSADEQSTTSALDQFFSNVQMNDQLIQRLERSLHSAVANVETLTRKGLLSPARSLAYEAGDLQGDLVKYGTAEFQQATHDLVLAVEGLLARMVDARFRLRDLVSWLRSAGSQVKARGTAPNSAQRENAKKRRVPQAVIQRLAGYFEEETTKGDSVTETLLGISVTNFLSNDVDFIAVKQRPLSPKSVENVQANALGSRIPNVAFAAIRAHGTMNAVFEQPRAFVSRDVTSKAISILPANDELPPPCAIHTRIGRDHVLDMENVIDDELSDVFSPQLVSGEESLSRSRNWSVIATAANFQACHDSVHLFAFPLGWRATVSSDEEDAEDFDYKQACQIPFYLGARLVLPPQYQVKEITFYADDGKSSLSAGSDSGTGREGRQAIGLLVSCPVTEKETTNLSEELWLFRYDSVPFHHIMLPSEDTADTPIELDARQMVNECTTYVQPLQVSQNEGMDDNTIVFAKTRRVYLQPAESTSQLLVSGSRGVGGVLFASSGQVELDLFDLEEDEEASDDEGEE